MVTCLGHVKHSQNFTGKSLSHLRLSFGNALQNVGIFPWLNLTLAAL